MAPYTDAPGHSAVHRQVQHRPYSHDFTIMRTRSCRLPRVQAELERQLREAAQREAQAVDRAMAAEAQLEQGLAQVAAAAEEVAALQVGGRAAQLRAAVAAAAASFA